MFSLLTGVYDSYLAPTQLNLLIVGAPRVGKTTLLERLKVTQTPKRPSKTPQTPVEILTPALQEAYAKGGAEAATTALELVQDTFSETTGSETDSSSVKRMPVIASKPAPVIVVQKRRFQLSICPAPERYSRSAQDQEEEFVGVDEQVVTTDTKAIPMAEPDDQGILTLPLKGPNSPEAPQRVRCHSKEFEVNQLDIMTSEHENDHRMASMESIPLEDAAKFAVPHNSLLQDKFEEFHVRPKAKMLPMSKIRPTIGTNLGKIEMYGAKCHVFDVGGKLQDLWERYYDDCDAVIFCWKLGEDPEAPPKDDDDDDNDEDDLLDISKQQEILNQVRKSISDDVPFLIFGHVFGNVSIELVDKMYSTDLVLPHYHNNLTGMCCGSAKTGAGVQHAMEWLIPLAKRQQKERMAARKKLEEEKEL